MNFFNIKKVHIFIMSFLVVLLISTGIFIGINIEKWFGGEDDSSSGGLDIDPNATKWEQSDGESNAAGNEAGLIAFPGFSNLAFSALEQNQSVVFANPAQNSCYFVVTLLFSDGTELYRSKLIPPGMAIYDITLTRALEEGIYGGCVIRYEPYKMDSTLAPMNGTNLNVTIIVD